MTTFLLVRLSESPGLREGLQLRGGRRGHDVVEGGEAVEAARVAQEGLEVRLGDAADRVDVRARAVVLGHVATEGLVDVGRPQDQQSSWRFSGKFLFPVRKL